MNNQNNPTPRRSPNPSGTQNAQSPPQNQNRQSAQRQRPKHPSQMTPEEFARYQAWLHARENQARNAQGQQNAQVSRDPQNARTRREPQNRTDPQRTTGQRTAGSRQAPNRAQTAQRRPLTPEEQQRRREAAARRKAREEYEKKLREQEKLARKRQRRAGFRRFSRMTLITVITAAVLLLLVGGGILIALHRTPDAPLDSGKINFYYGGTKVRSASAADCVVGDDIYICFNDLAKYLGMKESGSAAEMKFVIASGENADSAAGTGREESVTFVTGEHKVVINGQTELLDVPNTLRGEEIWISSSFVTEWMDNLSYQFKESRRNVLISRIIDEENSDPSARLTVYLPVSFRLKKAAPLDSLAEDPGVGLLTDSLREATTYELNFQTDLTDYEMYMNPTGDLRDAFLVLVNADHPLTSGDVPRDLVDVIYTSSARNTQQMREYATRALEALFQEMHHYGYYDMAVYSGYRSYDYQATIYEQYVQNEMAADPNKTREEAEALVLTYATRPGTSEHQTGLAVDMDTMGSFSTDFAWTAEYYWLQENAWKFGFILRFPQDKEDITTIQFEPWHYRYVGRYHAKIIRDNGLCLEEYIARISN